MTSAHRIRGSRLFQARRQAPMREYFAPDTLSFPRPDLVEQAGGRFPVMVNIEPSLRCNSNCIMCPRTSARRPVGDMDFGLYANLVAEMAGEGPVKVINFHKDGEPLMHSRLEEMIALARKRGACEFTHFNTNALLLDAERARRLLDSGIDDITMSVDAVSEETFLAVKRVPSLAQVERNVMGLLELRDNLGLDRPWIRAKIVAMPATEAEIPAFIARWENVADEVQVQEAHDYGGRVKDFSHGQARRYPCQCWWAAMAVNWDGGVSVCAVDYSGRSVLGHVSRGGLAGFFRGGSYRKYREQMLRGDFSGHPVCRECTVWQVGPDQSAWFAALAARAGERP